MDVFIVRPFGKKPISKKDKATGKVAEEIILDFDRVEDLLITPALQAVNLVGGTTGKIFEPGDIREDMFSLLLLADVVIADITIHNANVFYELGIRHALRDKKTILIKSPGFDDTPFDILGYKYVSYNKDDPAEALGVMIQTLRDTLLTNRNDSPVFYMLPKLVAQEPERFLAVPPDFAEEVALAGAGRQTGKLALLASEAEGFAWQVPALRSIGEALFQLKEFESAVLLWEKIRKRYSNDMEANDRLATIYQRLAEGELNIHPDAGWELLTKSDQAIERLLINADELDNNKKAEIYSLKGRNAKARWIASWKKSEEAERKVKALQSTFLIDAYEEYERAFNYDLNHFYSGINALGLLTVILSLAEALSGIWCAEFDSEEEAADALKKYKSRHQRLSAVVQASVEAQRKRSQQNDKLNLWLSITEADLACLTSNKPQRVSSLYQKVIKEANDFNFDAAKRQLLISQQLGVQPENVHAALAAFTQPNVTEGEKKRHYFLFTGHMIDKPDRKEHRFPPAIEAAVKAAIKHAVQKEKDKADGPVLGIAGGACGGDILYHEVCKELEIPAQLYLALPREQFLVASVAFAGPEWIERFDVLYKKLPRKELSETRDLPKWLQRKPDYSIWERNNLWMLNSSLVCGGLQMTLIALWDGKGGDGEGGTEHMVKQAKAREAKVVIIDIKTLNETKVK